MTAIRRQLLVALLSALLLALLLGAWSTYRMAREELDTMQDYQLRQLALFLKDHSYAREGPFGTTDAEFDFVFQVWAGDGARLYLSHPHAAPPPHVAAGFATVRTAEGEWRVFAADSGERSVQVAQRLSVRESLALRAALHILLPFLALLPLLAWLAWWLVGRGLQPLDRVAEGVRRRSPSSLEPLPLQDAPVEVQPVVASLNDLLGRLGHALAAQREFVADAAHELRTPLTALQLQVQLTERARDEVERAAALANLRHGLNRAVHVVQQLLTLARHDPETPDMRSPADIALAELAALVIADHAVLAEARQIDIGLVQADQRAIVRGDHEALRTLLACLVDNAVRYTPAGGRIDLSVTMDAQRAVIDVADSGPGIAEADRQRVFDRFYRRPAHDEPGSGLGLAIVKAIAERHGAVVTLSTASLGGLSVRLEFPSPVA